MVSRGWSAVAAASVKSPRASSATESEEKKGLARKGVLVPSQPSGRDASSASSAIHGGECVCVEGG